MFSTSIFSGLMAVALGTLQVQAAYQANTANNLAVYWGQNSFGGKTQGTLASYCAATAIDIIPIGFITKFHGKGGVPEINLSNACIGYAMFNNTGLLTCPTIADDIITCQTVYKKTILMSIAGDSYAEGGWNTTAAAQADADVAWGMFGKGTYQYRPFGNATVDGFDIDFETPTPNLLAFVKQLRSRMNNDKSRPATATPWMLTAAPQCGFPNPTLDGIMRRVFFDAIFVQFYNGLCGANYWVKNKAQTSSSVFNLGQWDAFATTNAYKSPTKAIPKIFLGIPGYSSQANYVDKTTIQNVIADSKRFKSFAGVMVWDASEASANSGYVTAIRKALGNKVVKRSVEVETEKRSPIVTRHHHHKRSMV